jgi:alkaline phosphatase D
VLGAAQRDWLGKTLNASVADGVRWQVFGNQVVMARVNGPDVRKLPVRVEDVAAVLPDEARRGARAIVLSGDSHTAWANQLHDASGAPVAAELGVTAISSPTRWLDAWLPDLHLAQALAERNAEVLAADDAYNGFVRLTLTPDMALGEWMSVDTAVKHDFTCFSQRRFEIRADQGVAAFVA